MMWGWVNLKEDLRDEQGLHKGRVCASMMKHPPPSSIPSERVSGQIEDMEEGIQKRGKKGEV